MVNDFVVLVRKLLVISRFCAQSVGSGFICDVVDIARKVGKLPVVIYGTCWIEMWDMV